MDAYLQPFKFLNRSSSVDKTAEHWKEGVSRVRSKILTDITAATTPGNGGKITNMPPPSCKQNSTSPNSSTHPPSPLSQTAPTTLFHPPKSPRPAIPNTDPLPTGPSSAAVLEGLLNHHTSQLQTLADRVESVNEWLELDALVLARLRQDIGWDVTKEVEEKSPRLKDEALSVEKEEVVKVLVEERVGGHCGMLEVRERGRVMRRVRKELERAVCWQREEFWRVERAMGKKKEKGGKGKEEGLLVLGGEGKWGEEEKVVSREKWSKESGRVPTQREWEEMFHGEEMKS